MKGQVESSYSFAAHFELDVLAKLSIMVLAQIFIFVNIKVGHKTKLLTVLSDDYLTSEGK